MDASKIRRALAHVHHVEKRMENPEGLTRTEAVRQALQTYGLNRDEAQILMNATHVKASEIRCAACSGSHPGEVCPDTPNGETDDGWGDTHAPRNEGEV